MSNQVSLFRFAVGKDIYEIRLNVDKTLLSSLPPDASLQEKRRVISDIARKHIQFSCEELSNLLSSNPQDPLKMDLSALDKTSSLIQFDKDVKTTSRDIALKALKRAPSSTSSTIQEPTGMDALIEDWLKDPDIAQASFGSGDTPQEILLSKIDSLPTPTLKAAKVERILKDFNTFLSNPHSLSMLSLNDWLFVLRILKTADASLNTSEAFCLLLKAIESNDTLRAQLDFLISIANQNNTFNESFLNPFFHDTSKKEIDRYIEIATKSTDGTVDRDKKAFYEKTLLPDGLSSTYADFLCILHKACQIPESDRPSTFEPQISSSIEPSESIFISSELIIADPDMFTTQGNQDVYEAFNALIKDYIRYKEEFKTDEVNTPHTFSIKINQFSIDFNESQDLFEDNITYQELFERFKQKFDEKKTPIQNFDSQQGLQEYISKHLTTLKERLATKVDVNLSFNRIVINLEDLRPLLEADSPSDEEVRKEISKILDQKYKDQVRQMVIDLRRGYPIKIINNGDVIDSKTWLSWNASDLGSGPRNYAAFDKIIGLADKPIDQKFAALEILHQGFVGSIKNQQLAMLHAANDSTISTSMTNKRFDGQPFYYGVVCEISQETIKIHQDYQGSSPVMIDESTDPQSQKGPMMIYSDWQEFKITREIERSGTVETTYSVETSAFEPTDKRIIFLDLLDLGCRKLSLQLGSSMFRYIL